jgi:hypothetical protein
MPPAEVRKTGPAYLLDIIVFAIGFGAMTAPMAAFDTRGCGCTSLADVRPLPDAAIWAWRRWNSRMSA